MSSSSGGIIGIPVSELALGGVAATCFLLLLARLRQAQSARRRIGERAPRPTGEQALVEMGAKAAADLPLVEFVDAALRLLTVGLTESEYMLPVILGVEVYPDQLVVVLDTPATFVPVGFEAGQDPREWVLWFPDSPEEFGQLSASVAGVPPALPSLVALGRDDEGVTVFVHLEAVGVVSLAGEEALAGDIVASLAMELATSPWSQQCQICIVGMGRPDGIGHAEPVRLYERLGDCLGALEEHAKLVQAALAEHEERTLAGLRLGAEMGEIGPLIVLCGAQPNPEELEALASIANDPTCGLAAVVVAAGGAGEWALEIADDGQMEIPAMDRRVAPQRLAVPVMAAMEGNLAVAASAPAPAAAHVADVDDDWFAAAGGPVGIGVDGDDEEDLEEDEAGSAFGAIVDDEIADVADGEDAFAGPSEGDAEVDGVFVELESAAPSRVVAIRPSVEQTVERILTDLLPHLDLHPDVLWDVMGPRPRIVRLTPPVGSGAEKAAPVGAVKLARAAGLEAATYIAMHDAVYANRVHEVVYPEQAARGQHNIASFQTTMTSVRTALGRDRNGDLVLSHKTRSGKFLISGGLTTWRLFQVLLDEAEKPVDRKLKIRYLAGALALLGDEGPFVELVRAEGKKQESKDARAARASGVDGVRHWAWVDVEGTRPDMEAAIVDAAAMLAQFLMEEKDHAGARKALRKGLMVTRYNVDLWLLLMTDAADDHNWSGLELIREQAERIYQDLEPHGNFELLDQHYRDLRQRRQAHV